jgi:hypothetical protein
MMSDKVKPESRLPLNTADWSLIAAFGDRLTPAAISEDAFPNPSC